jgi:hypothetical protein
MFHSLFWRDADEVYSESMRDAEDNFTLHTKTNENPMLGQ